MALTSQELHSFYEFALAHIDEGTELTLNELASRWSASRREYAETVQELQHCAEEMKAGIGVPFEQVDAELRSKHGFANREQS